MHANTDIPPFKKKKSRQVVIRDGSERGNKMSYDNKCKQYKIRRGIELICRSKKKKKEKGK